MLRVSILRKAANNGDGFVRRIVTNEPYPNFSFDISKISKDSKARLGSINTPHGSIETPSFVFCATKAAMKAITPQQLRETSAQIMLSNTYHLMLSPGADLIEKMGGLQKFTAWKGPMLTDSGGYQIFSMGHGSVSNDIKSSRAIPGDIIPSKFEKTLLGIDEQGAKFRSYVDQSVQELTPEKSIGIQRKLGADLIVVFDECTPFNVDRQYTTDSMQRSHRWATRSLNEFNRLEVQGSKYRGQLSAQFHLQT
jgi:queuine tRNA-ribosyltransferase